MSSEAAVWFEQQLIKIIQYARREFHLTYFEAMGNLAMMQHKLYDDWKNAVAAKSGRPPSESPFTPLPPGQPPPPPPPPPFPPTQPLPPPDASGEERVV